MSTLWITHGKQALWTRVIIDSGCLSETSAILNPPEIRPHLTAHYNSLSVDLTPPSPSLVQSNVQFVVEGFITGIMTLFAGMSGVLLVQVGYNSVKKCPHEVDDIHTRKAQEGRFPWEGSFLETFNSLHDYAAVEMPMCPFRGALVDEDYGNEGGGREV